MGFPSVNGQVFRLVCKTSPCMEVYWIVAPPALTTSAVSGGSRRVL